MPTFWLMSLIRKKKPFVELSKLKLEREQTTLKSPVTSEERHMQTIEKIWNQQKTQTDQRELKLSEIQVQTYFPGIDSPTKSVAQISTKESSVQTEDLLRKLAAETQTEIVSTKTALELNERGMQTEGQNPNFRSSESQTDSAGKLQFKDLIVQTEIVLSNNADSQTDLPVQIGSKMAAKGCEMAIQTTTEQLPTFTVAKSQTDSTGENLDDLTKQLKTAQLDNEKLSGQLRELQSVCERVAVEKAELCSKLVSLETSMENSEIGHSKEIQLLKEELKSLAQVS